MRTPGLPILTLTLLSLSGCAGEPPDPGAYPLIPLPEEIESETGAFHLDASTRVTLAPGEDPELRQLLDRWLAGFRASTSLPLPLESGVPEDQRSLIRIRLDGRRRGADPGNVPAGAGLPGTAAEAYELRVEEGGVTLKAGDYPGIFYGLGTLDQLVQAHREPGVSVIEIPAVDLDDAPRFRYRGMHLDVGRHFFPVPFVKRYLDLLAAYKMNVFHWHLTEDQGWRIEIRGYPRLTEVGSCRAETMVEKNFDPYVGDGVPYCGFYTQAEIREVVAYARERFITVIPEIEMPGHSVAALAAYPELACTPGPFEVATRWGVTEDIYCPKEETFAFLEAVLTQVMDLFPGPYIHVGGDEAPRARWEESEVAQAVMRREGLADEDELQSWFIRRIETFLNARGRKLLGWDEILEGGLAPNATVMSWRGMSGGMEAAREGHDVIMTPNSHLYLDHYQGDTLQEPLAIGGFSPLEHVYAFEPVPPGLSRTESAHILGAQGNVWTEYMASTDYVEYMVLPRLLALAEVVWSPRATRDLESFLLRLPPHLISLERRGINYRVPDVFGLGGDRLTLADSVVLALTAPVENGEIRYTLDGGDPGPESLRYQGPLTVHVGEGEVAVAARVVLSDGRSGAIRRAGYRKARLARPTPLPMRNRSQGLAGALIPGAFSSVDSLPPGESPADRGAFAFRVPRISLPEGAPAAGYGLVLRGFIRVPRAGLYDFFLASDDGSRLRVAGETVVDHDGFHGMSEKEGQAALHRGWHPIEVLFFQGGGGAGLRVEVEGPGIPRREVPADWLAHEKGGRILSTESGP